MDKRIGLTNEERLVIRMLNSACAQAARYYESVVLAALMDALSNLESGHVGDAVDRLKGLAPE